MGSTASTQCGKHRYREVKTNLNELTKPLSDLPSYFFFILVVGTCTAGQYGTTSTCEPCGIGTYQPSTGQGKCITCPNGSTTTTTGQSAVSGCSGQSRNLLFISLLKLNRAEISLFIIMRLMVNTLNHGDQFHKYFIFLS